MDRASAREPLAPMFYDVRHAVPRGVHAVERNRQLGGRRRWVFRSTTQSTTACACPARGRNPRYAVLLTMTSRADKLWPDERWIELARALRMPTMLPWGSEERARALRSASRAATGGTVPRRLTLEELARLFVGAARVVGLDTGLTHLAAALGVPTVGIYCGSDPALTGLYGAPQAKNVGAAGRAPDGRRSAAGSVA